ncbi:MAG TPA: VOC family protein [Thermoleophilaceae bacterium]|nr:VOC family protein [Thermoleophilaceae bacterium]
MTRPQADVSTSLLGIDHIALRVVDPDGLAAFLCDHLGMQRKETPDGLSLLGSPDAGTRLLLSKAEAPSDPGALERVVLRVSDLERALSLLPDKLDIEHAEPGLAVFEGPEGLGLGLTSVLGGGVDYDIDHVVLRAMNPDETTIALAELGFVPAGGALHVADKQVRVLSGMRSAGGPELLSHIGVLVQSVDAVADQAMRGGLVPDRLTLAPNRLGIYVRGPERLRVEYAERASMS